MKLQAWLVLGLLGISGAAVAEGGCPVGYTPVNNGQNWTCIPGGNDAPAEQQVPPPQPTGYWEKTWGAIATSETGGALGTALGASSEREAKRLALADCEAKGGGGCEAEFAYHNQCAVAVIGRNTFRMFGAASIDEATNDGISDCKTANGSGSCRVYYSACTEPVFHRY